MMNKIAQDEKGKQPVLSKVQSTGATIVFVITLVMGYLYIRDIPIKSTKGQVFGGIVFIVAVIALFVSFFILGAIVKLIRKINRR